MRKLATASIAFSAAIIAANYIISSGWLLVPAVICAVAAAALAALREKWIMPTVIALSFFAIGLLVFFIHCKATTERVEKLSGRTMTVRAEILDFPDVYEDYCRLEVRVKSGDAANLKAVLYDNDRSLENAKPGDKVVLKAKISPSDTVYGQPYDSYYSKGIYMKLSSKSQISFYSDGFDIFSLPKYISKTLSMRIEDVFPQDTQVFMRSLMLGDKADFYKDKTMYVAMSRAGLMHIVAVSGMHISFLVSLLYILFGKGRRSAIICIVFVWLFALVTGAGPAVLRAAFMQTTLLLAPALERENDSVTSLSVILALILMANPFAAASISLQLSFGAVAGILLFSGRIYGFLRRCFRLGGHNRILGYLFSTTASSLAVMAFTFPLTAVHFGTVSLLSPLTNIMSLWAVSACFCLGWMATGLPALPFIGNTFALAASVLARYIAFCAELISSVPFCSLYMESKGAGLWMLLCYLLFALAAFIKGGAFVHFVLPSLISVLLLVSVIIGNREFYLKNETINILDVGQGQCASVLSDEATIILDCGNISSIEDAGMIAASHLISRGRHCVDLLLLSHLHADHADGVEMLMEHVEVKKIILPYDYVDSDGVYESIIDCAAKHGTRVQKIARDAQISVKDIELEIFNCGNAEAENESCLITNVKLDGFEMLFMADASAYMEKELVERERLESVDGILVSHHGSKYSSTYELLEEVNGELAVISVGYNNYGHPSEETLERLERCGYNVHRTDEKGKLEIRLGQSYGKKKW